MSLISAARLAILSLGLLSGPMALAEVVVAPVPKASAEPAVLPGVAPLGIIIVHWKIKPGQEAKFLEYWSTRAVVEDRSGLVSEYLSSVEDRDRAPWITWQTLDPAYTSYFNVGIWRDLDAFQEQIGRHIDNNRPPLLFEAKSRERVFVVPQAWRVGRSGLPLNDAPAVR